MTTSRWLTCTVVAILWVGCGKKKDDSESKPSAAASGEAIPSGESAKPRTPVEPAATGAKGLAAKDNDPQYAGLAQEFKGCKEINTNCAAYAKKDEIGKIAQDPAMAAKARATFLNWMEEPSAWQVRNAGAHILWTQSLIDDASVADPKLADRVLAALKAEPGFGTETDNGYTAAQIADVLVRFAKVPANRPPIAAFIADANYKLPAGRAELIRLLDPEAYNDPKVFEALRAVAENAADAKDVRQSVRDSLAKATGANLNWGKTWLKAQSESADDAWAGPSVRILAQLGGEAEYKDLLASIDKRGDADGYLYYATWALGDFLRRKDVTVDKAAGAKVAAKVATNAKLGYMARDNAIDAVLVSGDPSFTPLAAKLAKDKEPNVAKHAAEALEQAKKDAKKP